MTVIILPAEAGALYAAVAANSPSAINCPRADVAAAVIKDIMAALADKGSV